MSGTVKKDGARGTWLLVVDLPADPATGRRQQLLRRGFATKKEAGAKLAEVAETRVVARDVRTGAPKTRAGARIIALDAGTVAAYSHFQALAKESMKAGAPPPGLATNNLTIPNV